MDKKFIKRLENKCKTYQIEFFFDVALSTKYGNGLFFEPDEMDYLVHNSDLRKEYSYGEYSDKRNNVLLELIQSYKGHDNRVVVSHKNWDHIIKNSDLSYTNSEGYDAFMSIVRKTQNNKLNNLKILS